LPEKAAVGNFENEFIMKRKGQLELWLNKLSSHPVINQSEVFNHFYYAMTHQNGKLVKEKQKIMNIEVRNGFVP